MPSLHISSSRVYILPTAEVVTDSCTNWASSPTDWCFQSTSWVLCKGRIYQLILSSSRKYSWDLEKRTRPGSRKANQTKPSTKREIHNTSTEKRNCEDKTLWGLEMQLGDRELVSRAWSPGFNSWCHKKTEKKERFKKQNPAALVPQASGGEAGGNPPPR